MIPANKAILELVDEGLKFHHVVVKGNADSNVEAMVRLKIIGLAPAVPVPVPVPAPAPAAAAAAAAPVEVPAAQAATEAAAPAAAAAAAAAPAVAPAAPAAPAAAPSGAEGAPAEVEETTMAEGSCEEMEAAVVMASVSNGAVGSGGAQAPINNIPSVVGEGQAQAQAQAQAQQEQQAQHVTVSDMESAGFKVDSFKVSVTRIDGAPVSKDNKVSKNFIRVNGFDQVSSDFYKIKMKMCDSTNKNFAVYRITAIIVDDVKIYISIF